MPMKITGFHWLSTPATIVCLFHFRKMPVSGSNMEIKRQAPNGGEFSRRGFMAFSHLPDQDISINRNLKLPAPLLRETMIFMIFLLKETWNFYPANIIPSQPVFGPEI